jgi:hypothetical protein
MCVVAVKYIDKYGWVGAKNRDRNYETEIDVVQSNRDGVQRLYIDDLLSRWTEGLNEYGVCVLSASFSVKSDEKEGDKITNARKAKRNQDGYYSPDGKAIRKALLEKTPEAAAKVLIAHELAGATYVFNKDEAHLIEGGFTVRKEDATKENPRVYKHIIKKLDKSEVSVRTNHGIYIEELGYKKNPSDEKIKYARKSSEKRYELAVKFLKPTMEDPSEIIDALAQSPESDPFMNPIRIGDTNKSEMVTTGQLLCVASEKTLHYRPIYSSVNFKYNKLNGPKAKTFFEIISSRKLLTFKEYNEYLRYIENINV